MSDSFDAAFLHGAVPPTDRSLLPAPRPGAPSDYSAEIADKIITRLVDGESLRKICRDPEMPDKATVLRWVAAHAEFERLYRFALEAKTDGMADEIVEIADDASHDYKVEPIVDGIAGVTLDKEAIARSKLRIDARKWVMAKEMPRKYGDLPVLSAPMPDPAQGDGARVVNPNDPVVIENDPLHAELNAWSKVARR